MPNNEYLPIAVHDEFVKRVEDHMDDFEKRTDAEHKRQNKRIEVIEDHVEEIAKLATSVERLAVSVDHMVQELKDQGERLKALEDRDGDKWRTVGMYIGTSIIGLIIGYLASKFGLK
jgi:septal ring factor EnvC (AmiA/AmiB activator)